jgi:hypothetical protein
MNGNIGQPDGAEVSQERCSILGNENILRGRERGEERMSREGEGWGPLA